MEIDTMEPRQDDHFYSRVWDVFGEVIPDITQLSSQPATYSLAKAFARPELAPLHVYRAASYLPESVLREIVQILTFEPSNVAPTAARLLSIMRGLPGNVELALRFFEQHVQVFSSLDLRTVTFFAFICGPLLHDVCDWGLIIQKAVGSNCSESKLALSCLYEIKIHEPIEPVTHIYGWESELDYAKTPSFWRELRWASFSRRLASTSLPPFWRPSQDLDNDVVAPLPDTYGNSAPNYVRICGNMFPRKSITMGMSKSDASIEVEPNGDTYKPRTTDKVVITQSVRHAIEAISDYLSHGVSFILEGPTGCGKTTILSYLARETLYSGAKPSDSSKVPGVTFVQMDNAMISSDGDSFTSLVGEIVPLPEGSGFTWRPGPIGLAAQRGDWLVFENISRRDHNMSSALPILLQLANAEPGDSLDAPGRGEPIRIGNGFRCIATRSTSQSETNDSWEPPGGWGTWKRVSMQGISATEKADLLKMRFASIGDCVERVVSMVDETVQPTDGAKSVLMKQPTLREAIRICRRLEATRNSLKSLSIENAVKDSYDVLGAGCHEYSEREHVLKILSRSWSLGLDIVRDLCLKHRPTMLRDKKLLSIGRASYQQQNSAPQRFRPKLAINGHTSRLLEIALRSVQMQEHVLLVGEAGSGKTSVVQELASLLNQELVVVNLSRQSDIGDLIGGFKPVELENAVPALGKRFERLLCQVMSKEKNACFLDALQRACSCSQKYERAIRLMNGALKVFPRKKRNADQQLSREWDSIAKQLEKLQVSVSPAETIYDANIRKSSAVDNREKRGEPPRKRPRSSPPHRGTNDLGSLSPTSHVRKEKKLGFTFAEGVLVKAMREGTWILLDEINLAPPELLERLVSVMDRGEVVLGNESGDIVFQAPGFFLFGAMNPPTDVGKRYLPEVLRARFSEIYVGDMVEREDIVDLVMSRFFRARGRDEAMGFSKDERHLANDITSFYIESCSLAREGRIEDNAGRPMKFSIRTLTRMLDFARGVSSFSAGGLTGIRCILYEGALLAFCTALPATSRAKLILLANRFIIRYEDGRTLHFSEMASMIPSTSKDGVELQVVEGFPLEKRTRSVNIARIPSFVVSKAVSSTLKDVCRTLVIGASQLPVLLQGPTAAGKTSMVAYLAGLTGNRLVRINNHEHTDVSEYIGAYVATDSGSLVFSEGPLVKAARDGDWVMLDELNLAPPDVLESLNRLLDDNREIFIPDTGETVKAAPGFRLFATQNPPGLYGGRKELSRAFRSRFVEITVEELPDEDLLFILERRSGIPLSFSRKMVGVMRELQLKRKVSGLFSGREGFVTARDLFRWASRHPRSKEELAVHGFFLLGERCRISSERDVVRNVLIKHTGAIEEVLSDESLYSLGSSSTPLTPAEDSLLRSLQLLSLTSERLKASLAGMGIALTPTTRRMLTLVVHCIANNEPVLLVGTTGGGKTTICSAVCDAMSRKLLTINCHRHTESSDLLGGFRPVRHRGRDAGMFEWSDGPLVQAMRHGCSFLIDEINMAEDAVIERLNSVLEPQRSLLLSERGSIPNSDNFQVEPELVRGQANFRILATMNPGGDYGKRELSPALRNRFTEVWIPKPDKLEDFVPIVDDRLENLLRIASRTKAEDVSKIMLQFLELSLREHHTTSSFGPNLRGAMEFHVSLRDLRAWCDFVVNAVNNCEVDPVEALMHGARVIFLDGLSVGGTTTNLEEEETRLWYYLLSLASPETIESLKQCRYDTRSDINLQSGVLGDGYSVKVDSFVLHRNTETDAQNPTNHQPQFCFKAPSTKRNIARLTRALAVTSRPVLLEGPPGSGKSSLISALADLSGNEFIRVNLSESTEMSDLVGADAPDSTEGSFKFHEGPLLKAMKRGSWLLLDELNLASQSVLEGLNSVLDHRRTVFIPETNEVVSASKFFRVFGAQNPVHGGGGRRGLPQSFLNRFTKVVVDAPSDEDILRIIESIFSRVPKQISKNIVKTLARMRKDDNISCESLTDFGLRDALRWCDVLCRTNSFWSRSSDSDAAIFDSKEYLRMSFDVSVLQGLRGERTHKAAEAIFEEVFGFEWSGVIQAPSLKAAGASIRVGFGYLNQMDSAYFIRNLEPSSGILDISQLRALQATAIAVQAGWPVVLLSDTSAHADDEGKNLVHFIGMSCGKKLKTFHGSSLVDSETLIGGYSQRGRSRHMLEITTMAQELLPIMIRSSVELDKGACGRDVRATQIVESNNRFRSMCAFCRRNSDHNGLSWNSQYDVKPSDIRKFASEADGFIRNARLMLQGNEDAIRSLNGMASYNSELWKMASLQKAGSPLTFEWKKSELLNAIERGDWIYIQGAEMCPPAVLDRLNPLFERPAVSPEDLGTKAKSQHVARILLAEAPSEEGGSPIYLTPHPDFRIFFAVSRRFSYAETQGLSRPLLDRSLRVCLENLSNDMQMGGTQHIEALGSFSYVGTPQFRLSRPVYLERHLGHTQGGTASACEEESGIENVSAMPTRSADFVLRPELSCLDVDLWNFIQTTQKPEGYFETATKAVVMSSGCSMNRMESLSEHDARRNAEFTRLYKRELQSTMSQAIILASSNSKDMDSRILWVKKFADAHSISQPFDDAFETAVNSILNTVLPGEDTHDLPCSIDPIYAMDRLPTEIILLKENLSFRRKLESRAILFRAEILAFYRFQKTWERAASMSRPRSLFAQARLKSHVRGSAPKNYMQDPGVDVMCFELLTSIGNNLELTRRALLDVDHWQHPCEAEVHQIYDNLCTICEIMEKEQTSECLWAPLRSLSRIGTKICEETDADFFGFNALKSSITRIQKLDEAIRWLTYSAKISLMPRSKQAQLVEKQLMDVFKHSSTSKLPASEADMLVRAINTLSSRLTEGNTQIIVRLKRIADSLKPKLESNQIYDWDQAVVQFRSVVRLMSVRSMKDCFVSLLDVSGAPHKGSILNASNAVESLWSKVRCIPSFYLESLVAIMRLCWLLDLSDGGMKRIDSMASVDNIEKDLFLLALLREMNQCGKPRSSSDPLDAVMDSNPVKATVVFLQAPQRYLFWDLETAYHQAAVTTGMLAFNSRICDPICDSSFKVMFLAISSALRMGPLTTEPKGSFQDLECGSFHDRLAYVASLAEQCDSGKDDDLGSRRPFEDEKLALASVVNAFKTSSASENRDIEEYRCRGTAWIAIGVYRIQSYLNVFDDLNGSDPSVFVEERAIFSLETRIKLEARRKAYEVLQRNRLGGDEFLHSIPSRVLANQLQEENDNLAACSSDYVYRDPDEAGFESFVGLVQGVKSNIVDFIKKNGFVSRAKQFREVQLPRLIPEAMHLIEICKRTSKSLGFYGSHCHFRDISLRLRLGVEEIHHGLQWLLQATELIGIRQDPESYKKLKALTDLCFLPRAAFRNARELPDAFSLSAEIVPNGRAMMVAAKFLLENDSLAHTQPFLHLSEFLSRLVKVWKASVERSEMESEIRESLHIIRQSSQRNELNATSFLDVSEQQEIEDFISTFNPIGNDIEDELLGFQNEGNITLSERELEKDAFKSQGERVLEINSSDFWTLHQLIFPGSSVLQTRPSVQPCADTLLSFAKELSVIVPEELESAIGTEIVNGPWGFLCSQSVARTLNGDHCRAEEESFRKDQHSNYNFYKDPNVQEVQHSARILLNLKRCIEKIQLLFFKENGNHPVLEGITLAIDRVAKVSQSSTPLSIVVIGLENVLRKADEWNRLFASRHTKLHAELIDVSKLVSRWRRIEMNSWPFLLQARKHEFDIQANKWVFLIYDAVINECLTAKNPDDAQLNNVVSTIDRFLRSSPSGEFPRRLAIVQSISHHLLALSDSRRDLAQSIGHGLRGICQFYRLFEDHLEQQLARRYDSVLQELREFTSIVSYNPQEELGSAVEMSKGRDKNLDYFRLKAMSEKTRRRIHKLCLKVDEIFRVPFYQHMTEFTAALGLSHPEEPDWARSNDSALIQLQNNLIMAPNRMLGDEGFDLGSKQAKQTSGIQLPAAAKLLSRFDTLQKRLVTYGRRIRSSGYTECEAASEFSSKLRKVIRSRVAKLRELKLGNDIQPKRRALVDLLQGLLKVGLSPFEKPHNNSNLSWIMKVDPSSSEVFNKVANHLYFLGIHQYQTLRTVSDSGTRNNDISGEEAARIRAFCRDLLEKSAIEREELNRCCDMFLFISNTAQALTSAPEDIRVVNCSNPASFYPYRELLLRLRKTRSTLRQVSNLMREAQSYVPASVELVHGKGAIDQVLSTYWKIGSESMMELQAILNTCCEQIGDEPTAVSLMDIFGCEYQELSYFDGRYDEWCEAVSAYLTSLRKVLRIGLSRAQKISQHNLVTELLSPLLALLEEYGNENREEALLAPFPEETSHALRKSLLSNAEELVRSMLISSQKAMTWNGVSGHPEEPTGNGSSLLTAETGLFPSGAVKRGHDQTVDLGSYLHLTQLVDQLEANAQALRRLIPLRRALALEEKKELIGIQKVLGLMLKEYVRSMLQPCLKKASVQHSENLALLRTLTSLFIGICKDGFCRPNAQEETDGCVETDVKSGVGFGDTGDGDLNGAQDVSEAIEDEEQLLGLREEISRDPQHRNENVGNEDGFEMKTDFEGELENVDDGGEQSMDDDDEPEKQMGEEHEKGENILNEKLWDSDNEINDEKETDYDSNEGKQKSKSQASGVQGEWAVGERGNEDHMEDITEQNSLKEESLSDSSRVEEENKRTKDEETEKGQEHENPETEASKHAKHDNEPQEDQVDKNCDRDTDKIEEPAVERRDETSEEEHCVADINVAQDQEPDPHAQEDSQLNVRDADSDRGSPMMGVDVDDEPEVREDEGMGQNQSSDFPENCHLSSNEEDDEPGNDKTETGDKVDRMEEDVIPEHTRTPEDETMSKPSVLPETESDHDKNSSEPVRDNDMCNGADVSMKQPISRNESRPMNMLPGLSTTTQADKDVEDNSEPFAHQGHGTFGFGSNINDVDGEKNDDVIGPRQSFQSGPDNHENINNGGEGGQALDSSVKQGEEEEKEASSMNINPLRLSDPEDLVKEWDECLRLLHDEDEKLSPQAEGEKGGDMWQFETNEDPSETTRHALGAASQEQQRPLPEERVPDLDSKGFEGKDRKLTSNNGEAVQRQDGQENGPRREQSSFSHDSDDNYGNAVNGDVLRSHPARSAISREQEPKKATSNQIHVEPTTMEVRDEDGSDGRKKSEEPKLAESQIVGWRMENLNDTQAKELWHSLESKVASEAATLCEQMRLVLEPTEASRMGGGYRTGKRLNMRKVIEYVASNFRRDQIWLRRVKPEKRSYDVMIAIDDSASMVESEAGIMATESLALVISALSKLEVGRIAVASFGSTTKLVRSFEEPLPVNAESGASLLQHFTFSQTETNIVNLLTFILSQMGSSNHEGAAEHVSLAFVISDGRLSDRDEVRRQLRRLKEANVLVAFFILDRGAVEENSIYNVQRVEYEPSGKMSVKPYMHDFPIDFYAVVQNMRSLPGVLADALRQWIEVTNYQ